MTSGALRISLVTVLFAVSAPTAAPLPFVWWTTDDLAKVRPLDPVPAEPVRSAELRAGRNEFEPFQIVLRSQTKDLAGVDIDFSDFRSAEGATISSQNVTVYLESFVDLKRASSVEGADGPWPDPLIPRIDRYSNERRNAFPFTVPRGRNQPLWVEVFIPVTAQPGKYTASARVTVAGVEQFSVPISLIVWRFSLPSTASLKSSFGLSGIKALKQHRGRYTNDEDLQSIVRLYTQAALMHRITTNGGSMQPPKFIYEGGKMHVDWSAYDAEVGPFLDGTAIPKGDPLYGARATSAEVRTQKTFPSEEQERLYWSEWTRHFHNKGWDDRLFLYLWDEPTAHDFPEILERGKVAARVDPKLRSLITLPFNAKLQDVVQIWAPLVNCLEPNPGFADYCQGTPPLDIYSHGAPSGTSLWFYQSCASHGCNIVGGSYFTGWPNYMIDIQGPANRVMQWVAWKYRLEGELYYSMNEAFGPENDPWTNILRSGGNGDGTLFYPGLPDRIGGRTGIPVESIRLKLIREGMEDYEYLVLLAKLEGRESAEQFAGRIVQKPYLWESRPQVFLNVRQQLGDALDRAAARPGGMM
ncbi:MAG TPA: glycoside hydrolase domain-containing protein [Bryobacteraceae bacterium]|nr:glycoside hydrolase domain-containing protein [Bryobacteraceae bacterium]